MKRLNCLALLAVITACTSSNDVNVNHEIVYINDAAIQCEFEGLSEVETAQILIDSGIDVLHSQCGYITGIAIEAQCGLGDSNINLHTINSQNVSDAISLGFLPVSELNNSDDKGYEIIDCQ